MTKWKCDHCGMTITDEVPLLETITVGPLTISPDQHLLLVDGKRKRLSYPKLMVLYEIIKAKGRPIPNGHLRSIIEEYSPGHNIGLSSDGDTMTTHIYAIRKQLSPYGSMIANSWGFGYKLKEDD